MNIEEITDMDLRTFCKWYVGFHGSKPVPETVLTTCLCGYFATHSKTADKLLARLKRLNLIQVKGTKIMFLHCYLKSKGLL